VKGASIPTTWTDVLKPEFAGQIIFADPRANEPILEFLATLHDGLGDDFIRKLGQQKPRYVPAIPQGVEQVIAGEAKLYMPALAMNLVQYKDLNAPISIIPTPSPTNGTYFFSAIPANAPNKDAARFWYAFVLSREGQEILCKDNGISPLGEIPGLLKAPASLVEPKLKESIKKAGRIYDLLGLSA
jgi:iron(III) transport system substrate-binding protein